jgi:transcriptional regulator GlxA family with amidase domain
MNQKQPDRVGWLAGLADPVVGSALNAMRARPTQAWTLDALAAQAASSRSVLAERFRHLVGTTPMHYLAQVRMLLAANLLRQSNASLARVAEDVGYQTDTAFIRAFRREMGCRRQPGAEARRQRHCPYESVGQRQRDGVGFDRGA